MVQQRNRGTVGSDTPALLLTNYGQERILLPPSFISQLSRSRGPVEELGGGQERHAACVLEPAGRAPLGSPVMGASSARLQGTAGWPRPRGVATISPPPRPGHAPPSARAGGPLPPPAPPRSCDGEPLTRLLTRGSGWGLWAEPRAGPAGHLAARRTSSTGLSSLHARQTLSGLPGAHL